MVFTFRTQPFKALCLIGGALYILARLPFWVLRNLLPSWRPRQSWTLKRSIIVALLDAGTRLIYWTAPLAAVPLEECAKDARRLGFVWVEPVPQELVVGEIRQMAEKVGVRAVRTGGFWYGPRGEDGEVGQRAGPEERVMGSSHPKSNMPPLYNGFLKHLGPHTRVFALEYRVSSAAPLVPANPFPAALLDALAGYRYLVHTLAFPPSRIVLSGDSAGGGLAFALARYLAVLPEPRALPQAGALLLLSPTLDWSDSYASEPGCAFRTNVRSDYVAAVMRCGYTPRALLGPAATDRSLTATLDAAAKNLWISPGARGGVSAWTPGAFAGMPHTLLFAGGAEMTLDGMRAGRARLVADNGEDRVEYVEMPDAAHDFLLMEWHEPERSESFERVRAWVDARMPVEVPGPA
ncbi:alpha/beta-hydrolase [Trametes polyzona]|nr:alpha/beta-hydrolase [Trametes polyzona]